jgi:hypothetical protein
MNVCVVGCIFGAKFRTVYPAVKNYDAYFFTNNPEIKETIEKAGWKYIFVDLPLSDDYAVSTLQSKYIKFLQFLKNENYSFLNKYNKIVYSDHKLELKDYHIEYLLEYIGDKEIMVRDHPQPRNNIWEEVGLAMFQERYLRFMPQTIDYIRQKITEGYSEKPYGCDCATTLILYNIGNHKVIKLTDEVYNDLTKLGTPECQIIWAILGQKYVDIIKVIPWNSMDIKWEEPKKIDEIIQENPIIIEEYKGEGRFYFDTGKNFNEEETVHFNHSKETNHFNYEIILPQNTKAIRFDPVEGYGCFVQNLVIKSDSGVPIDYQNLNGFKSENNGIIFTTTDPQILIVFDQCEIKKIEVNCDIWFFN